MNFAVLVVSFMVSLSSAFGATKSPFRFDEFREEVKTMAMDHHTPGHSYSSARKMIMQEIDIKQDNSGYYVQEVYCKIKYRTKVSPRTMPNHTAINIEHTWPRSRFGVRKGSAEFRVREADLHHLYPSDSVANSTRGNFKFTQFPGKLPGLRGCPSSKRGKISAVGEQGFEPPENHKGNVARALFYFAVRYDLKIAQHEEMFLRQWNIIDPVDSEEIKRNDSIEDIQGNRNPFVDDPQLVDLITNF
ncbi:MAG: endonuclease I [Bacteriovoracaceae bacterium]|jgi:deoxyribonuclease-1